MLNLNYQNIKAFIHKNYLNFKILCSTFPKIQSYKSLTSGAQQTFIFICESDFGFCPHRFLFLWCPQRGNITLNLPPLASQSSGLHPESREHAINHRPDKKDDKNTKNVTRGKYIRLVLTVLYQVPEVCLTADGPLYR